MNATQMKYLFNQLESIQRDLVNKIHETYKDYPDFKDLCQAIRDGHAVLKPQDELRPYVELRNAFMFPRVIYQDNEQTRTAKVAALAQGIQEIKNAVVFEGNAEVNELLKEARELDITEL